MNKVILMGRLTRDPEMRYVAAGAEQLCVTKYALAVDRRVRREGEPDADFINCVAFGKAGEFSGKFFKKGMMVTVSGRLQISSYEDKQTGQKKWMTDVILEEQEFAESKASFESRAHSSSQEVAPSGSSSGSSDFFTDKELDLDDDNLPF